MILIKSDLQWRLSLITLVELAPSGGSGIFHHWAPEAVDYVDDPPRLWIFT